MKLLVCTQCGTVVSVSVARQCCRCGESWAKNIDMLHVEYDGPAVILGFDNSNFARIEEVSCRLVQASLPTKSRGAFIWPYGALRSGDGVMRPGEFCLRCPVGGHDIAAGSRTEGLPIISPPPRTAVWHLLVAHVPHSSTDAITALVSQSASYRKIRIGQLRHFDQESSDDGISNSRCPEELAATLLVNRTPSIRSYCVDKYCRHVLTY